MTNVFVKNLCSYRARFSIQSLFKTTPCPLKRQHENHTGVLASDSSHEYTVDRQSSRYFFANSSSILLLYTDLHNVYAAHVKLKFSSSKGLCTAQM